MLRTTTVKLFTYARTARPRSTLAARWLGVGLAVSLAGVAAVAGAQSGTPAPHAPAVQVGFEHAVSLSPPEMLRAANGYLSTMTATGGMTQRMLAQARNQRDVVKTLCLDDKLSEVDVATRSATDRLKALKSAVAANNSELATHEFTILTVLQKRSAQLAAEANQCIGEEAAFTGATNVVSVVDPGLPVEDPTTPPPPVPPSPGIPCIDCGGPGISIPTGPPITASAGF